MPYETLTTIKPRKYQSEIYEVCKDKNCLVVLPTGIGKTLVALMLAINRAKVFPGSKTLFLAPTRPLANQHLEYFKKHLPELFGQLELFTGKIPAEQRKKIWQTADIIFSTPQCVGNDLKKNLYNLEEVSLLIVDECHRCLKNYAYTYVAEKYKEQAKNPRILGLTASPGAERKMVEQIAKNLNIDTIELRTRESSDVKEYLQELKFEVIHVDFPEDFEKIHSMLKIIFQKKIDELKNRKLLFGPPIKTVILETQGRIMKAISSGNRNFNLIGGVMAASQAIKIEHALELLETQTLESLNEYLQNLFEQARKKESKSVQQLVKRPEFNQAYILLQHLLAKKIEHPKLIELKKIVKQELSNNPKVKIIVFSQYRSTVTKICKEMNSIEGIKAKVFVGQAKKTNSKGLEETGLSQKEQQEIIKEFSEGRINLIACTSIGEEGLDICEVSTVIFYEPVPSAIRTIQRRGRTARLSPGKLFMLITKNTRDEAYYWAAFHKEKKMHAAIQHVKDNLDLNNKIEEGISYEKPTDKNKNINNQKTLF